MRLKALTALLATAAFVVPGSVAVTSASAAHVNPRVFAKTCPAGYVHAIIGGSEECLHRGEYCARRYEQQYERYGFRCNELDRRGRYHLT